MNYNKFKELMETGVLIVKNGGNSKSVDELFKSNGIDLPESMLNDFMEKSLNKKGS